ncbi:hypothetical protein KAZ82_01645 [Candidatus Babeliales bacterium]|nr:hypothetical protein [Candidatus Babeliales bacterium]
MQKVNNVLKSFLMVIFVPGYVVFPMCESHSMYLRPCTPENTLEYHNRSTPNYPKPGVTKNLNIIAGASKIPRLKLNIFVEQLNVSQLPLNVHANTIEKNKLFDQKSREFDAYFYEMIAPSNDLIVLIKNASGLTDDNVTLPKFIQRLKFIKNSYQGYAVNLDIEQCKFLEMLEAVSKDDSTVLLAWLAKMVQYQQVPLAEFKLPYDDISTGIQDLEVDECIEIFKENVSKK